MKINKILLAIFISFSSIIMVNAQTVDFQSENQTFIYDTIRNNIKNKNNIISNIIINQGYCEALRVNDNLLYSDIFQKIFSNEKLDKLILGDNRIIINFYCDIDGNILETEYFLRKTDFSLISWSDISELDKALKGQRILLERTCPNVKYYRIVKSFRFKDIYKKLE